MGQLQKNEILTDMTCQQKYFQTIPLKFSWNRNLNLNYTSGQTSKGVGGDIFSNAEKAYDGYTQIYKLFKEALEQSQRNKEWDFKKHEIKTN